MYAYGETFQTMHTGTQFVLLDEYSKAHLQVTQLNQMCDGTWAYPVKQSSATTLDEPVVIVCSNKPPEDVYPNFYFLVLARFRVFELQYVLRFGLRGYRVPDQAGGLFP